MRCLHSEEPSNLSLSLTPPSDSPSLCEGGQSRGSWLQSSSKTHREKYRSTTSDSVHVQNKRGHMTNGTAEWTEQSIAPDVRDWCITLIWRLEGLKSHLSLTMRGQGQHVPNKDGGKTISRTFTAGEKDGERGSQENQNSRKMTFLCTVSLRASPKLLNIVLWELFWWEKRKTWEITFHSPQSFSTEYY